MIKTFRRVKEAMYGNGVWRLVVMMILLLTMLMLVVVQMSNLPSSSPHPHPPSFVPPPPAFPIAHLSPRHPNQLSQPNLCSRKCEIQSTKGLHWNWNCFTECHKHPKPICQEKCDAQSLKGSSWKWNCVHSIYSNTLSSSVIS